MSDSVFWELTENNEVRFPCWENLKFSDFWWEFLQDTSKNNLVSGGRGAAKSFTVVFKELCRAFDWYSFYELTGYTPRPVGAKYILYIICPTTESYQPIIQYIDAMLPEIPGFTPRGEKNFHRTNSNGKSRYLLFGRRGIEIRVFSGYDADTLRGKGADVVVLDEAFLIKRDDVESAIVQIVRRQGNYLGYFTALGTPDTERCKDPWFDGACDEADPKIPERTGYFTGWKLWECNWLHNPEIPDDLVEEILKEKLLNPLKFLRERMGVRNLVIQDSYTAEGNVWSPESLTPCYYTDKVTVTSLANLLVGIDLAYGGKDSIARIVYDKATNSIIDLVIVDPPDKEHDKPSPEEAIKSVVRYIIETAKQYPGATIYYDKSGRMGSSIPSLIPAYLTQRVKPIDRNNSIKNRNVETLIARMQEVDAKGVCQAVRFPSLEAKWLTDRQRGAFKRLYVDLVNYWCEEKTDKFGKVTGIRYTKRTHGDDTIDALTILMDHVPPIRRESPIKQSLTQMRRGGFRRAA